MDPPDPTVRAHFGALQAANADQAIPLEAHRAHPPGFQDIVLRLGGSPKGLALLDAGGIQVLRLIARWAAEEAGS